MHRIVLRFIVLRLVVSWGVVLPQARMESIAVVVSRFVVVLRFLHRFVLRLLLRFVLRLLLRFVLRLLWWRRVVLQQLRLLRRRWLLRIVLRFLLPGLQCFC